MVKLMDNSIENKIILITGASSGIGYATAKWLAKCGAKVALVARRQDKLTTLQREIHRTGGHAHTIQADITLNTSHQYIIEQTVKHYGHLDGVFNNAGTLGNFVPLLQQSEVDLELTLLTNFKAIWLAVQAQANYFKSSGGGAIVNTSSWLSDGALIGSTTYSASKGALDAFIRPAAIELSQFGIRINNVSPGGISTEMTRQAFNHDQSALDKFAAQHPLKRLGTSVEVAHLVSFLLSNHATNITGQTIHIDGGYAIPGQR